MCLQALVDVIDCASLSTLLGSKIREENDDNMEIFLLTISETLSYVFFSSEIHVYFIILLYRAFTRSSSAHDMFFHMLNVGNSGM